MHQRTNCFISILVFLHDLSPSINGHPIFEMNVILGLGHAQTHPQSVVYKLGLYKLKRMILFA